MIIYCDYNYIIVFPSTELSADIPLAMKLSLLNDTARGLSFLHSHTPSIIHPILDASDVMVSSAMVAKITDLCNAQYGLAKQQDVNALAHIGSLLMGLSPKDMNTANKDQLSKIKLELVSILIPCFAVDSQSRPNLSKLISQLEQLSKRVPFQLSEMGTMMVAIKEWRTGRQIASPPLTPGPPVVKKSQSIENLLHIKDRELVELKERNLELVAAKKTIERQLAEQEEQLHQEAVNGKCTLHSFSACMD